MADYEAQHPEAMRKSWGLRNICIRKNMLGSTPPDKKTVRQHRAAGRRFYWLIISRKLS
jgi:hypothetical protein